MSGAGIGTQRVTHLNANWTPSPVGDGRFELLIVTEDGERRTTPISNGDLAALTSMTGAGAVLLWDPDDRTLIVGNIVGEWIPPDWTASGY